MLITFGLRNTQYVLIFLVCHGSKVCRPRMHRKTNINLFARLSKTFQITLLLGTFRSNRPEVLCKKYVLRNFAKFTGKHLCQRLFLNKVAGLRPATLLKKSFWHRCFPVNFAKFLRTPFLQNTSGGCFWTF